MTTGSPAAAAGRTDPPGQEHVRFLRRARVQRCVRLLSRAVRMTPREAAHRLAKRLWRNESAPLAWGGLDRAALGAALDGRFVIGPARVRTLAETLRERWPHVVAAIVEQADRIGAAGVEVFGQAVRLDPRTIDWVSDPVTGRRLWPDEPLDEAGAVACTRDPERGHVTDVKFTWDLSRCQFLSTLGAASVLENDGRHAALAVALVDSWVRQNPPYRGVNWSSGLEVGLRAIAWLWTLGFVSAWDGFSDDAARRWTASLGQHYDFLRRNLSIYADPTNHLIGEVTALWMLATVLPELPGAAAERERSWSILEREITRQVCVDGMSREQSVGYHCFVLDFLVQALAIAGREDPSRARAIEAPVRAMMDVLHHLAGTGGELPRIGDGDDGRGLPYVRPVTDRERAEALLAFGARWFQRPAWRRDADGDLALWLVGPPPDGADRAAACPVRESRIFRDSGYAFLEGVTGDGTVQQMVVDVGGLGYLQNAAHEHADALSIVLRVGPATVLADPGTGSYTRSAAVRDQFRGTAAHNTVVIDGADQADVLDTFKWLNPHATRVLAWTASRDFDHVAAVHGGYERLRAPVRHRRDVLFVRPDYWVVVDEVTGRGTHDAARWFHFPPEAEPRMDDARTVLLRLPDLARPVRFLLPDSGAPASLAHRLVAAGPWSPAYGRVETAPCLVSEATGDLPMRLITIIAPGDTRLAAEQAGDRSGQGPWTIELDGPAGRRDSLVIRSGRGESPSLLELVRRDPAGSVVARFGQPDEVDREGARSQ